MSEISTKPYLLRALYEWCTDNGYTPYLATKVDAHTRVPTQFVHNGEIVLDISYEATQALKIENEFVHFNARFGGIAREISIPMGNIIAIYAHENGQGMAFEVTAPAPVDSVAPLAIHPAPPGNDKEKESDLDSPTEPEPPKKNGKPILTRIK